jgi:hypothetical protein
MKFNQVINIFCMVLGKAESEVPVLKNLNECSRYFLSLFMYDILAVLPTFEP